MSGKMEKDRQKQIQDKCQNLLTSMLRDDDNKYCVDCDAKGPRWASWNLGIFLCIRCAGIHRNLGVHISKVKSVNLDAWTPEQVTSLQQMGNSRARAVYEASLPDNFRRPQSDVALEAFIRGKYEAKKYIASEWVPPPLPKVNWDKELEEEEKARRKKRESKNPIVSTPAVRKMDSVIPQPLSKPIQCSSGGRGTPPSRHKKSSQSHGQGEVQHDLLGLDTPVKETATNNEDDVFTSFLSAPPESRSCGGATVVQSESRGATRTQEEENFFSQAGSVGDAKKLTTDSILALYAKGPAFQSSIGNTLSGQPPPNQAYQPFLLQNGMLQQTTTNMQGGVFQQQTGVPTSLNLGSNPFYNMGQTNQPHSLPANFQANKLTTDMSNLGLSQCFNTTATKTTSNTPQRNVGNAAPTSLLSNNLWQ